MSHLKHATVSAWQRDHDGAYAAEINGYSLKVTWQPESVGVSRGFFWEGTSPDGKKIGNKELHEEIELAMSEAEAATEHDGAEEAN